MTTARGASDAACFDGIHKPDTDMRLYRKVVLGNGMHVLLISDSSMSESAAEGGVGEGTVAPPEASASASESMSEEGSEEGSEEESEDEEDEPRGAVKKGAAAMCVWTGSFSDPNTVLGLSHFLEHMLFMGSDQFPDENEYDAYLSKHGGMSNAYTETEYTNFHFDVRPDGLRGALERFAGFFVSPLCKEDSMEREIQAVESEFVQALQSDGARSCQLRCHTARPGHVYAKFSWGNRKSLFEDPKQSRIDTRQELLRYYRSEYSAERMSLCVLGGEPLDVLQSWVGELFSKVSGGRGPPRSFPEAGYPFLGGWRYKLPMTKEGHELHVLFQLPCLDTHYRTKPDDYASHLIGHEGAGSLLSVLRSKGLVTDIFAGVSDSGYDRNSITYVFGITARLTEKGLGPSADASQVLEHLFAYINLLRRGPPERWIWEELRDISRFKFRFAEEEDPCDYVTRVAANLRLYRPEHTLEGEYLHEVWDQALVAQVLDRLDPRQARVEIQSSSLRGEAFEQTEPWFQVPYRAERLPEPLLSHWASVGGIEGLALPQRNEFIATDFAIRDQQVTAEEEEGRRRAEGVAGMAGTPVELAVPPFQIDQRDRMQAWYKFDRFFRQPRMCAIFSVGLQNAGRTAKESAALSLATRALEDALVETTYSAEVAALHTSVYAYNDALEVKVEGFSHKLPRLVGQIFRGMAAFNPSPGRFAAVKENLVRAFQNSVIKPSNHALYLRLLALRLEAWPLEDRLACVTTATADDCRRHLAKLLSEGNFKGLLHGNVELDAARAIIAEVGAVTALEEPFRGHREHKVARLKPGQAFVLEALARNPGEGNSCSESYYQIGPDNHESAAALSLLEQLVCEPLFNVLRTKEQLGYSVSCGMKDTFGLLGFAFTVVTSKYAPQHVEARLEAFLAEFTNQLAEMPDAEFEQNKTAAADAKQQQDHSLLDESERHWDQISVGRRDFFARHQVATEIKRWTRQDFLAWFRKHFGAGSPQARRITARVFSAKHKDRFPGALTYPKAELEQLKRSVDVYVRPHSEH